MKNTPFLFLTALLVLSACGGSKSGSSKLTTTDPRTKPEVVIGPDLDIDAGLEGQYLAVFSTLNPKITSKLTGAFTFSREKELDELVGDIRLTNAGPNLLHSQYVRLGSRCPTVTDDKNSDGIIDAAEGEAVYGKVYFPLDGDLTSQSSHDGEFPVGDVYGNYVWSKVTTFSSFIQDMRSPLANDGYHKLVAGQPLDIEGKVVVIHGVDEATDLPATVGTINRIVPYQTLPIVCGVIKKVMTPPGRIDSGTYSQDPSVVVEPPIVVTDPAPESPTTPEVSSDAPSVETEPVTEPDPIPAPPVQP